MQDPTTAAAEVEALTPQMQGRWQVRTRNALHLFDLDARTYQRIPGAASTCFAHDGRPMPLTRVDRWPAVGGTFLIWLDDPDQPDTLEHWRKSSTIRSIRSVPHTVTDSAS